MKLLHSVWTLWPNLQKIYNYDVKWECVLCYNPDDPVHKYPSSSHYTRDWDKLAAEVKKEEKDEKLEGDAALNKLFQQIYTDGSDEVRKAMNKSFVSFSRWYSQYNYKNIYNSLCIIMQLQLQLFHTYNNYYTNSMAGGVGRNSAEH